APHGSGILRCGIRQTLNHLTPEERMSNEITMQEAERLVTEREQADRAKRVRTTAEQIEADEIKHRVEAERIAREDAGRVAEARYRELHPADITIEVGAESGT